MPFWNASSEYPQNMFLHEELKKKKILGSFLAEFTEHIWRWSGGAKVLCILHHPTDIGLQLGKACYPCSG